MNNKTYKVLHGTGQGGMGCSCCLKGNKAKHRRTARLALKAMLRKHGV